MSYNSPFMLRRHSQPALRQTLESRSGASGIGFWLWLVPLVIGAACLFVINIRNYHGSAGPDENSEAAMVAINFAKDRFGSGVVLRFAPLSWTHVEHQEGNFVISGWVEAVRSDNGRSATYDYTCEISRDTGGDWHLMKVDFFQSQ